MFADLKLRCVAVQELTLVGSIAYVDSLALFKQLPAQLTLISISTEFVLRHARPAHELTGHPPLALPGKFVLTRLRRSQS